MESFEDYYEILQVSHKAEPEVIDAAYKKLAQKYHPDKDKSPNANEKMKLINIAHDVLSNYAKRNVYHQLWLQRQNNATTSGLLVTDHRWRDIDYKDLKPWVKRRKVRLDAGEVFKGRYFRYRLN